jgi:hypothetical protein
MRNYAILNKVIISGVLSNDAGTDDASQVTNASGRVISNRRVMYGGYETRGRGIAKGMTGPAVAGCGNRYYVAPQRNFHEYASNVSREFA